MGPQRYIFVGKIDSGLKIGQLNVLEGPNGGLSTSLSELSSESGIKSGISYLLRVEARPMLLVRHMSLLI